MKLYIRYKTRRQANIFISGFFMALLCVYGGAVLIDGSELCLPGYIVPFIWLLGIAPFMYCITYNLKRNAFKKKGVRKTGKIIGYNLIPRGRMGEDYCLKIQFYENEKKVFVTEPYIADPNEKLANTSCYIYNYNGKYIEADLNTLKKGEKPRGLNIPIVNEGVFPKIKSGSVTVVEQTKDEKG